MLGSVQVHVCESVCVRLTCAGGLLTISVGMDAVEEALDGVGLGDADFASFTSSSFTKQNSKIRA